MPGNKLHLRLSHAALEKLEAFGQARGLSRPSEIVERLLEEAGDTPAHYLVRQAAFQSYVTMALVTDLVRQTYRDQPFDPQALLEGVSAEARLLFGPAPEFRPDGVGEPPMEVSDPRLRAVLEAYGVLAS